MEGNLKMTLNIILGIVLLVAALFLIIAVLIQSGKSKGVSSTISGGSSETYFGKNKGTSLDKKLAILTVVVAVIFMVVALVVYIAQPFTDYYGWLFDRLGISVSGS